MDISIDDILDFTDADAPTFSTLRHRLVVVTSAGDFPGFTDAWNWAVPDDRISLFWRLGLAHLAEVAVVRLAEDPGKNYRDDTRRRGIEVGERAAPQARNISRSDIERYTATLAQLVAEATKEQKALNADEDKVLKPPVPAPVPPQERDACRRCRIVRAAGRA